MTEINSDLTLKQIAADLLDFDRHLISRNEVCDLEDELERAKEKIIQLTNALETNKREKNFYKVKYREFEKENKDLKAEIDILKSNGQNQILNEFKIDEISDEQTQEIEHIENNLEQSICNNEAPPSGLGGQDQDLVVFGHSDGGNSFDSPKKRKRSHPTFQYIPHEKPFKCPICFLRFYSLEEFQGHHVAEHLKDFPKLCSRCPYSTKDDRNWSKHQKRHVANEKAEGTIKCEVESCNVWLLKYTYKTHLEKYH